MSNWKPAPWATPEEPPIWPVTGGFPFREVAGRGIVVSVFHWVFLGRG